MKVHLGAKLAEGSEVIVYEHKTDPHLVVKIPRDRPDLEVVLAERLAGEQHLHQAGLSAYVLETNTAIPGIADGREYAFVETQRRVKTTLFDDVGTFLAQGRLDLALKTVALFFDFERGVLWASGVVMRDAGSFLKNVAIHQGQLRILDFSSMTRDPLALDGMILRGKAERRIRLALEKLQKHSDPGRFRPVWNAFQDSLWELAQGHYRLDRMKEAWLATA